MSPELLDEWQKLGYHVLKELERLNQSNQMLSDKVIGLQLKVAAIAGGVGTLGGAIGALLAKHFIGSP